MTNPDDLYNKLKNGPAFLFLGQEYLSLETGVDPFLTEILRKYGTSSTQTTGYNQILGNQASQSIESALAWMQDKCRYFSVPIWLETVADFAWNGVQTSAIDVIWQRAFKTSWRELEPIFTEDKDPIDARSRTKLHCTYLFGTVDQASSEQRAPLTRQEFNRRRQVAVALARRIPRLVTPFGVLVIEGYSFNDDWLPLNDLLVILDELVVGQVHFFHAPEDLSNYPDIVALVETGKLRMYPQSLASFLKQGEDILQLGSKPEDDTEGRHIRLNGHSVSIPLSLWNQVSRSAIILDDTVFSEVPVISDERRYSEFRSFLARSGERPVWSGYVRKFAFKRDFEDFLFEEVSGALELKDLVDEPIILHGQSGVGKTVALGALAYRVREAAKHPVLYIERRPLHPNQIDLDAFVVWAEQNSASTTLIIWDGMLDYDQYSELLQYLTGRGRKVVLVGSTYHLDEIETSQIEPSKTRETSRNRLVEARSGLTPSEVDHFEVFITELVPNMGGVKPLLSQYGANFFVALYRLLPPTRSQMIRGINLEAIYSEERIRQLVESMRRQTSADDTVFNTPLAYALVSAGYLSSEPILSQDSEEIGGEFLDQVQRLIGLVMVPGRFGLTVPVELLMRTLRFNEPIDLVPLLSRIDIFSWESDPLGNIMIGPRHLLEAELIARTRLGGPKYEIDFVAEFVRNIVLNETELQFVIDLVRKINPPDEDLKTNVYGPYLLQVADAFTYNL